VLTPTLSIKEKETEHIGCVVFVQNAHSQVLLAKRKNAYKAGYYGAPGGRVDGNESLAACAARELLEEVGLTSKTLIYVGVIREWQETHTFVHFIFVCTEWDGNPTTKEPDKAEKWAWHDINALPEPIVAGHVAGLQLLQSKETLADLV
jgi:8-oxo-dGTP diphosphatase